MAHGAVTAVRNILCATASVSRRQCRKKRFRDGEGATASAGGHDDEGDADDAGGRGGEEAGGNCAVRSRPPWGCWAAGEATGTGDAADKLAYTL